MALSRAQPLPVSFDVPPGWTVEHGEEETVLKAEDRSGMMLLTALYAESEATLEDLEHLSGHQTQLGPATMLRLGPHECVRREGELGENTAILSYWIAVDHIIVMATYATAPPLDGGDCLVAESILETIRPSERVN